MDTVRIQSRGPLLRSSALANRAGWILRSICSVIGQDVPIVRVCAVLFMSFLRNVSR